MPGAATWMTKTFDFMKEKKFNPYRKIHPTAQLKNLSRKRQREIVDYLDGTDGQAAHSLKNTAAWLESKGVKTAYRTVSRFRTWYLRRAKMEANQAAALDRVKADKKKGMFKTLAEEKEAGQIYFNHLAVDQDDVHMWVLMQRLALAKGQQELNARKIKLLEESKAMTKEVVKNTEMTPEQKEERIRQIMGLD
jgi:hypothetical protein